MGRAKKFFKALGAFSFLLAATAICLHYQYPIPAPFPSAQAGDILIAHAGGAIDGHNYTNSREAVRASIRSGFKFIELDLLLTSDRQIVAGHDWQAFDVLLGVNDAEPLSLAEVKKWRILGKYTPLNAEGINTIFLERPDLYLATDKLDDFDRINEQLAIPRDRLLVEVFSYKEYARALRRGIKYPLLCIWDEEKLTDLKYDLLFMLGRIRMITIPAEVIPGAEKELSELLKSGVRIFAFSSNDIEFMRKYLGKCVTGFYTDTISPPLMRRAAPTE